LQVLPGRYNDYGIHRAFFWSPSKDMEEDSNLRHFVLWLKTEKGAGLPRLPGSLLWSTQNLEAFWGTLWEYFNITFEGHYDQVRTGHSMPHCRWFEGARLNYAEHVFQKYNESVPAIIFKSETESLREISWRELRKKWRRCSCFLCKSGIREGDCPRGLSALHSGSHHCISGSEFPSVQFGQVAPLILEPNRSLIVLLKPVLKS